MALCFRGSILPSQNGSEEFMTIIIIGRFDLVRFVFNQACTLAILFFRAVSLSWQFSYNKVLERHCFKAWLLVRKAVTLH